MSKYLLLFLAAVLLLLTGCWSRIEVDKLAIVRCLAIDYLPEASEPYLVTLSVARPAAIPVGDGAGGGGAGQGAAVAPPPEVLSVDGTAVFRDEQLAGFLTPRETRGYLLLAGRARRGQLSVPDPLAPSKSVSLGILRGKSKITPRLEAGRLS